VVALRNDGGYYDELGTSGGGGEGGIVVGLARVRARSAVDGSSLIAAVDKLGWRARTSDPHTIRSKIATLLEEREGSSGTTSTSPTTDKGSKLGGTQESKAVGGKPYKL